MKILPAIDILDGSCVRLLKGDFNHVTKYDSNPINQAKKFIENGFDYLHIIDLNAASTNSLDNLEIIQDIAKLSNLKIQVGGRLNGAEIARTEWTREGRVPLHTLRAEIDYATKVASTTYGVLGIKVWVFKGEVLAKEDQPIPVGGSPRRRGNRRPQQFEDRSNEN